MGSIISIPSRRRGRTTMTDFLIRGLGPDLLEQLRARAKRNGRSLQAEVHDTLERSVRLSKAESIALLESARDRLPRFSDDSTPLIREFRDA